MKKVFLCALLAVLALSLCACGSISYSYANAGKYTAGGTVIAGPVDSLEIDWIDGSVTVAYHKENTVEIAETAKKNLSDTEKLHWWLDGTTLHIKYARSETTITGNSQKALTVTLPENASAPLKNVEIASVSGSIRCVPLYAENVKLSSVSGSINAECAADTLNASTVSGKTTLTASANEIRLSTTSGSMEAEIGHAKTLYISGISGKIRVTATEIKKAEIDSVSGAVEASMQKMESLKVGTVSGSVRLSLPKDMGFTADFSTVSGSLNNDISAQRTGNRCVLGDGSAVINVSTVSGSLTLSAYQEK
ncbi:MAG: DUF4097 family beta strand repeat protein [Clostridia bacterium]|nr:DUF4097 family beta strand repeat protein [Clostridia bacterium]